MASMTWGDVPLAAADPILGLNELFQKDTAKEKVNLTIGAYRTDEGKPWVLPSVQKAQELILKKQESGDANMEYLGIAGNPAFLKESIKLAYGDHASSGHFAAMQCLSGTGACKVAGEFIAKFQGTDKPMLVPNPTWSNHINIFEGCGFKVVKYSYWDTATNRFDLAGCLQDFLNAPDGSPVLLHGCAHNPTGTDPTKEQWKEMEAVIAKKGHLALFDVAYQGFASGDLDADAWAPRYFMEKGQKPFLCQSYAKNMGLYGQRVGCFSMSVESEKEAEACLSQLKWVARPAYSSPPRHGVEVALEVMAQPELLNMWYDEMKVMSGRIKAMREGLEGGLAQATGKDWSHITEQIGMFAFTGLSTPQCEELINKYHIYLTKNGRISLAGLNTKNLDYVVESISKVSK